MEEMIKRNLYFKDNVLFANGYVRIVYGKKGPYVELTKDNIVVPLVSHFDQKLPLKLSDEIFFYYWLEPKDRTEKIYWQCNIVHYADYKRNFYYISPKLLIPFNTIELF